MATPGRALRLWLPLLLAAPIGLVLGWFLPGDRERTFDYLYALLAPALIATVCTQAVTATTERHRWVVPVFLVLAIVNVINRPHLPALTALSIAAAAIATVAALRNRRATAVVSAVISCVAISASLLLALRTT
jgi:hypothetical protein